MIVAMLQGHFKEVDQTVCSQGCQAMLLRVPLQALNGASVYLGAGEPLSGAAVPQHNMAILCGNSQQGGVLWGGSHVLSRHEVCVLILIKSPYSHTNINNSSHQNCGDART